MNHTNHEDHKENNHSFGHGSAQSFLRRFWMVTFLLIPLALTNEFVSEFIGLADLDLSKWIQFGIATVIFGFALVFFQHASHEIKARKYGMMTLVSLAVGSGYLFSVFSTFIPQIETEFYLEISTLIWVLLFGHYLESRSGAAAGNALQEVAKLLPKKAHKITNGKEINVDVTDLLEGDVVLVRAGEKIPADGVVIKGAANVNESHISGESKPVKKEEESSVVAGAICLDGSLTVRLNRVGKNSTIGQIQKLISEAQHTKPKSQRIADRAAAILTFVAGLTSLLTLLVWSLIMGESFVFAGTLAITVLVIACPHALGLAIPTVTTITTSLAVKNGVFLKNLAKLEVIKKADYIIFDKTGTLTTGEFGVTDIISLKDTSENELITIAASLEQHSSHIIGEAIVKHANNAGIELRSVENFKNIAGKGIEGRINKTKYIVGNMALMQNVDLFDKDTKDSYKEFLRKGKTTVLIADEKNVIGIIGLSDKIKNESKEAVRALHNMGIKVAMLTGDNRQVAEDVAEELGIDIFFAEVLPEDKYKHVKKLQDKGNVVLMVGDGVNDAPALTQSDAGIAIGAGTDVAVEAGDVVLTQSNPIDIVKLILLSKKVYRKMIQNLVWALGYNIIAIPAAAGVFAAWGFFLRPEIGALVMSLSTLIVVINAMMLKRVNLAV